MQKTALNLINSKPVNACCCYDAKQTPFKATHKQSESTLPQPGTHIELQAQRVHDFDNDRKAAVALFAQSLVQPFAVDGSVSGQLHHAVRPCDVTYGFGEQGVRFNFGGLGCCPMNGRQPRPKAPVCSARYPPNQQEEVQ